MRTSRLKCFKDLDKGPSRQVKDDPQFLELNRLWHGRALAIVEKQIIEYALDKFRGKITAAAAYLGVTPRTLYNRGYVSEFGRREPKAQTPPTPTLSLGNQ